jgi:hypothetical protein
VQEWSRVPALRDRESGGSGPEVLGAQIRAAAGVDDIDGDPAAVLGGEEGDDRGDVGGFADSLDA